MHHTWERKLKNVRRFRRKLGVVSEENNTGEREKRRDISQDHIERRKKEFEKKLEKIIIYIKPREKSRNRVKKRLTEENRATKVLLLEGKEEEM